MVHLSWTKIFWYKPLLLLLSTYWPFSLCKILKNPYSGSRIMTMHHFWTQNDPFAPNNLFLENYYYHSHLPISSFHCAKFKKNSSSGSRVTRMHNFWAQNGPFAQMRIFSENLLMSVSTCQKSNSYVKLLVKYWQLKNTEILLAKRYFWL